MREALFWGCGFIWQNLCCISKESHRRSGWIGQARKTGVSISISSNRCCPQRGNSLSSLSHSYRFHSLPREWSGGSYLGLHTIFTYMVSILLADIVVALLVAFNKHTRRLRKKVWINHAMPLSARLQRSGIVKKEQRPSDRPLSMRNVWPPNVYLCARGRIQRRIGMTRRWTGRKS